MTGQVKKPGSAVCASNPRARRAPAAAALLLLLAAAGLAGCAVGPKYQRPPVTAPDQFYGLAGPAQAAALADLPWWEVFQDPTLKSLIDEALRDGYEVRIAAARVEEARARFGIAGAELYPQVGYQGQFARERFSGFTPGAPTHVTAVDVITANLNLSWEVDLWGRVRHLTEAAKATCSTSS